MLRWKNKFLCLALVAACLVSSCSSSAQESTNNSVWSNDTTGLLYVVASEQEKSSLADAVGATIVTVSDAVTETFSNYTAIAVPFTALDSFELDELYNSGLRVYIYGNTVSIEDFNTALNIPMFGRSVIDASGAPAKEYIDPSQVFQILSTDQLQKNFAALLETDSTGEISPSFYYNVISLDYQKQLATPMTLVASDTEVFVSTNNGLFSGNFTWRLERDTDEIDSKNDYFGINTAFVPTVTGGGTVASIKNASVKISVGDSSKEHLFDYAPKTTPTELNYSFGLSFGSSTSANFTISGVLSSNATVKATSRPTDGYVTWAFTRGALSGGLNDNRLGTGFTYTKDVSSSGTNKTTRLSIEISATATGWSTTSTLNPNPIQVVYDYR